MISTKIYSSPIRWAGSKRKILDEVISSFDLSKKNYIEPFLGSGIVLINLLKYNKYDEYYVNDINSDVIMFFKKLQTEKDTLISQCKLLADEYNKMESEEDKKKWFYKQRNAYNLNQGDKPTIFWALMKTCFNGVYRTNSKGLYNVPFGRKKTLNFNEEDFNNIADSIKNVHFYNKDYQVFLKELSSQIEFKDSFIYCDPPYLPETESTENHVLYTKSKFNHKVLANELNSYNASIMISMSNSPIADSYYSGNFSHKEKIKDVIRNVNPQKILKTDEIIYTNYTNKNEVDF